MVDLDASVINNIIDILEHESYNSYSQNPTIFFIANVTKDQLQKIIDLENIHCIINTNVNIDSLPKDSTDFVFYNKKSNKFLNFDRESLDLSFETQLIKTSSNQSILQDKFIKIKSIATRLFTEMNENADKKRLIEILSEYEKPYWDKIIQFTENYYQIQLPKLPRARISTKLTPDEPLDEHLEEYDLIIKSNAHIAVEFVKALHEYRFNKVNPANLELMELFSPRQLYCYLRTHHWDENIPEEFIKEWVMMKNSHYRLSDSDYKDFLTLFSKLDIPSANIEFPSIKREDLILSSDGIDKKTKSIGFSVENEPKTTIPSIEDFSQFKKWIYDKLDQIETQIKLNNNPALSK